MGGSERKPCTGARTLTRPPDRDGITVLLPRTASAGADTSERASEPGREWTLRCERDCSDIHERGSSSSSSEQKRDPENPRGKRWNGHGPSRGRYPGAVLFSKYKLFESVEF